MQDILDLNLTGRLFFALVWFGVVDVSCYYGVQMYYNRDIRVWGMGFIPPKEWLSN